MAEKQSYPVQLYDANGGHVGAAEHDEDMMAPDARNKMIESGGKHYLWDQRSGRWMEAGGVVKVSKAEAPQAAAATPAAPEKK